MKCYKCEKGMKYEKEIQFNEFRIPGWRCSCGEVYYDPEQIQNILLLNKLQKERF